MEKMDELGELCRMTRENPLAGCRIAVPGPIEPYTQEGVCAAVIPAGNAQQTGADKNVHKISLSRSGWLWYHKTVSGIFGAIQTHYSIEYKELQNPAAHGCRKIRLRGLTPARRFS